ncbi:hypothetical protein ACRQ5Q_24485 [Bradyrhizobium sp. PMVTL-01]|uniref:hypothetical protein n=1 Tax=Bradyrhizobium sp. PMVTL-01 TaxID=3434999 RepID=UPI003F6F2D38
MRPSLDDLRRARPDLALAVYAMEPGGEVTLEIYDGGQVYAFKGATEADAILAAFPQETAPPAPVGPDQHVEPNTPGGAEPSPPQLPDRSIFD